MKILTTPWKDDLLELVHQSKKSIKITSPFVKKEVCAELFASKNSSSSFELITSFKIMSIYVGALDLSAMELILENGGVIMNYSRLHSKVYLFDEQKAIITSGNLTTGGLLINYEYGDLVEEKDVVDRIASDFALVANKKDTGVIGKSEVQTVKKILEKIPKTQTLKLSKIEVETPEENFDIIEVDVNSIASSLSGWKLDVFECINSLNRQQFSLKEAYAFGDLLKKKHPKNNWIGDKIRQKLQELRDLGLIEFLGNGEYKKLWV